MEVPLELRYPSSLTLDKELILTPGATKSGFETPSIVGPRLEKLAMVSSDISMVLLSLLAPTVITLGLIPGDNMVPLFGPLFPASYYYDSTIHSFYHSLT